MKLTPFVAGIFLALAGCCGSDSNDPVSDLAIKRNDASLEFAAVEHDDGTVTKKFLVDRMTYESLAYRPDENGVPPDPFAALANGQRSSGAEWPARKILESMDVPFPEGTEAAYDLNSLTLTVRNTPEWVDFIQFVLESLQPQERMINLRLEIYEVPKALALRLEQSAGEHSDHRPEWAAVDKIVQAGDAEFVTSCNLRSRPGQRAFYQDGVEHMAFTGFEWDTTVDPPSPKPRFKERTVGTVFEIDPVLGSNGRTVGVNLSLEHHTAPPAMVPLEVPVPGSEEPVTVSAPSFHAKTLITQITILDGGTKLLCSWRPTGRPEFESGDLMQIAFLRVDVQKVSDGYE